MRDGNGLGTAGVPTNNEYSRALWFRFAPAADASGDKSMTTDSFIATVRKYTRAKKLTPRMLSELVDRIEVHNTEKVDGVNVQKLTIH